MGAAVSGLDGGRGSFARLALPLAVGLLATVLVAVPRAAGPLGIQAAAALVLSVLFGLGIGLGRHRGRAAALASVSLPFGAALLAFVVGVLGAHNPAVSFLGVAGQHSGWLLWALAAAALAVGLLFGRGPDIRFLAAAVGLVATVAAATVFLDLLGAFGGARYSIEPAGLFENSISAAQYLVLGLACALTWADIEGHRSRTARAIALACAVGIAGALVATGSRAAFVGIAAGLGVFAADAWLGARGIGVRRLVPAALLALSLIATSGLATLDIASSEVDGTIGQRIAVWGTAIERIEEAPLLGHGPEQFSAWNKWRLRNDGGLANEGTYDPHNVLLGWALAGGLVGLVLMVVTAWSIGRRALTAIDVAGRPRPLRVLGAGLAAWWVSLLFAWTNPLALLTAMLVTGALIGSGQVASRTTGATRLSRVGAAVGGVVGIAIVAWLWTPLAAEVGYFDAVDDGNVAHAAAEDAYAAWPDSSYAVALMTDLASRSARLPDGRLPVERSLEIAEAASGDAVWDVNIGLLSAQAQQAASATFDRDTWDAYAAAIEAGRTADPTSTLWDLLLAIEAQRVGRDDEAFAAATEALASPATPESARPLLEEIASATR